LMCRPRSASVRSSLSSISTTHTIASAAGRRNLTTRPEPGAAAAGSLDCFTRERLDREDKRSIIRFSPGAMRKTDMLTAAVGQQIMAIFRWSVPRSSLTGCAILCVLLPRDATSQTPPPTPSGLVQLLIQAEPSNAPMMGLVSCYALADGSRDKLAIIDSLAGIGAPALKAVEDEIDRHGPRAPGAWLLPVAYARIAGPAGFPRLRQLMDQLSYTSYLEQSIEFAAALSLGLTSSASPPMSTARHTRPAATTRSRATP
jgi:hypothetical protein